MPGRAAAQQPGQRTFASAEEASKALVAAAQSNDEKAMLAILGPDGKENWPTPIPVVKKGNAWYFDTEAGKKEILYRRVGRNELSAIRICQELVAAQKEYYAAQHDEYAQKIFSDPDQHNGLYWKASANEPQSPIGPLVAAAVAEGYAKGQGGPPTPTAAIISISSQHKGKTHRARPRATSSTAK